MCFYFTSHNICPRCRITFNARLNRVPCWNGRLIPRWLSLHTHGLRCRCGARERSLQRSTLTGTATSARPR